MSVECTSLLGFHRPLTSMVKKSLFLCNPHQDPIVFKIKTTAPRQYCVRPNSGRIEAGQEIEVLVLLQALKEEPPLDYKCKDKFLIQSIVLTDKNITDTQSMLSLFDSVAKEDIHEKKIKCVFLNPEQNTAQYASEKSLDGNDKFASFQSSKNNDHTTDSTINKQVQDSNHSSPHNDKSTNKTPEGSISNGDLAVQLIEAKATIKKLKDQLKESELRFRSTDISRKQEHTFSEKTMITTTPKSVPIHICIALCLVAFFLAYFAF